MKVYIAFSNEDLNIFNNLKGLDDLVLVSTDLWNDNYIDAGDISFRTQDYIEETRNLFSKVSRETGIELDGYANNFFECSLRLSLFYCKSIDKILSENTVSSIVFSKKLVIFHGEPNYYLAEHESQGRFMYDRRAAIQPGVVNFLSNFKVRVEYLESVLSFPSVRNIIRDIGVLGVKFVKDLKKSVLFIAQDDLPVEGKMDAVVIVRSSVQFEFVKPLIENSSAQTTLYIGRAFLGQNLFKEITKWGEGVSNVIVKQLRSVSTYNTASLYFKRVLQYLRLKKYYYEVGNFKLNVTQALREVILMSAETSLYKLQLEQTIPQNSDDALLFSCEQKSPHAHIDALFAMQNDYKCLHLMTCDQESNDLPFPVYGDFYVVDTLKRFSLFESSWSTDSSKLLFVGSIKSIDTRERTSEDLSKYLYCYFAHVTEVEHNLNIIKLLEDACKKTKNSKYCIKLHPRDDGKWLESKRLSNGKVIMHGQLSNSELFDQFEVGISNPSAVVMDLLCKSKKFIFIDILKSYKNIEYVYIDKHYPGIANNWVELEACLKEINVLNYEVESLKERIFGKKVLIPSIDSLIQKVTQ